MPRVPHSCRHYRREQFKLYNIAKYGIGSYGKRAHRTLLKIVLRESKQKRLQDMMYKALPPPRIWLDYPSWGLTITGIVQVST